MTSFSLTSGSSSSTRTLKSGESGSVSSGATLSTSGVAITWDLTGSSGTATITNSGTIASTGDRAIDSGSSVSGTQNLLITNNAGAFIQSSAKDAIRVSPGSSSFAGTVTINNSGTIRETGTGSSNGQALDLLDINSPTAGKVHVTNQATGLIQAADSDAIRIGKNALIDNYGKIEAKFASGTGNGSGNDGIDAQTTSGQTINNYQGGQILGARHGISGTGIMSVDNDGAITGNQGSGINLDTTSGTATIVNDVHGVITGTATSSTDGDGIDVDYLVNITNHGTIQALGTFTGSGLNEALAIGGGTVINDGTISSAQRAITVDDSNLGSAFGALNLTNSGTITGGNGSAIAITGSQNDIINNSGTITGSIATDNGNDTLTNSGTISGAIDMGGGNDTVNWNGLVAGTVGGGGGTDALAFNGTFGSSSGSASITGFESVSGTLTGSGGNDVLNFSTQTWSGSLTVNGGNGTDQITGGAEIDTLNGDGGNDTLKGGAGNDIINGGTENDTAIFGGTFAAATVTRSGSTYTVTSTDGTDTVTNVENFQFADKTISGNALTALGNMGPALTGAQATLAHGTEDHSFTVTAAQLLAGFTDGNNDTLSIAGVSTSNGDITVNGDGTYTIDPDANFNGQVTLNYTVADGYGGTANGQISFTLDGVNDGPVQTDYQAVLPHAVEDTPYVVTQAQLLQGFSDVDGDTLSISSLTAGNGTVTDNGDGTYTITNNPDYNGQTALSYTISDGHGGTINAQLALEVDGVNDAPALTGPQAVLPHATEDASFTITHAQLIQGFSDADGDAPRVLPLNLQVSNGTVQFNAFDGSVTVTPGANFNGVVTVSYTVSDGHYGQANSTAGASLSYVVDAVNDAPTGTANATLAHGAEDVAYTVTQAQLLQGISDADGDTLGISGLTASNGTVTDNHDGTYTVTQAADFHGDVTLSYSVTDGQASPLAASLGYTVDAVNDGPALTGAQAVLAHGSEDTSYTVSAAELLTGFSDADGDVLTVSGLSASNGSVTDNGDGTYTVTQAADFNGDITLSYSVTDGNGGSVAASLGYTVDAANDGPALTAEQAVLAHGSEDASYTVSAADLLTGFSDADGDALSVSGLSASNGTVTDNGDGTYTVTQAANVNGAVTLSYSVVDGHGGSVAASLGYVIDALNDDPALTAAQAILAHGTQGETYTVSVAALLTGFSDIDGDVLDVSNLTANHGTVTDNHDGTWTIAPAGDYAGDVTLSYNVFDGHGGSLSANLHFELDAVAVGQVITGTTGNDILDGGAGDDIISGLAGDDQLYGNGGNDVLHGGLKADLLDGGSGIDTASYSDIATAVTVDLEIAGAQNTKGGGIDTLISIENLIGGNGSDRLLGDAGDNRIEGGAGADTISGRGGNDILIGGDGVDIMDGGLGNDRLEGGTSSDQLYGNEGNDTLIGGDGNDILDGGKDADILDGGLGNDQYYVDNAGDQVTESSAAGGTDTVTASVSFTLGDNVEKLTLVGLAAINGTGNALDNVINGGDGNNILSGGAGKDTLNGGFGADTFLFDVLETTANKDTIGDFTTGYDRIALSVGAFSGLAGFGLGALDADELTFGTKATAANQHLIYNASTGGLFYDADGAGGAAQVQIALLSGHPTLVASDVVLIA